MSDDDMDATRRTDLRRHVGTQAVHGAFWFMSGTIARALLRLVVVATLARLLLPEHFGLVGAASVVIVLADLVATSGIIMPLVQRRTLEERHIRTAFTANVAIALAMSALVILLAPAIAGFFRMPQLAVILQVLTLLFPLNAASAVAQKLLERDLAYRKIATVDFLCYAIGYAAVALALAFLGAGVWSLVFAAIGSALVRSVMLYRAQPHSLRPYLDWTSYRELMSTGLGFGLVRVFNIAALKGDYLVVGRGLGAVALGFYERAYVLMDLSNSLLTNSLSTVLFPTFAKLQDDRAALAMAFLRSSALIALLVGPASILASILAPEFVTLLLGGKWTSVIAPFQLLALGMFFRTGYKVSAMVSVGVGAVYRNAATRAVQAVMVIGGAWIALPYGILGVAASTLLALIVVYLLLTSLALAITGTGWLTLLRTLAPALLYSLVAAAAAGPIAFMLRGAQVWPGWTFLAASLAASVLMAALALLVPASLGQHGRWLCSMGWERLGTVRTRAIDPGSA